MAAAERLGVDVVIGSERRQALEGAAPGHTLTLDWVRPERSLERIAWAHRTSSFRAVIGLDDETTLLAARAAAVLGLRHNSEVSVRAARDKHESRQLMSRAGLRVPAFRKLGIESDPREAAARVDYPCVLKPFGLSASRGVIRADEPDAFVAAFRTVASILEGADVRQKGGDTEHLLVEDYWPGREVALEGLLESGTLRVLALFDKPDALEGPTFEETIYVTPSRLPDDVCSAVHREVAEGCRALGLSEGPVHAELRVHDGRPWLVEVAARTIGGLCSRTLRFGAGLTLEELVLRHALGRPAPDETREKHAAGVMMIPIPRAGVLREVRGLKNARAAPLIEEVTITMHRGTRLEPLPRGDRYLGFIFARGDDPADVERALREANGRLTPEIED